MTAMFPSRGVDTFARGLRAALGMALVLLASGLLTGAVVLVVDGLFSAVDPMFGPLVGAGVRALVRRGRTRRVAPARSVR